MRADDESAAPASSGPAAAGVDAFPLPRRCPFSPPPEYARLRAEHPVARLPMLGGDAAWVVSRHADVRQVLSDPRMSADRRRPGFPKFAPTTESQRQASFVNFRPPLNWMDPPEHGTARRQIVDEFSAQRVRQLRPLVERVVDTHLDALAAGPPGADLVAAFGYPVSSQVICEVLGVPYADHEFFERRSTQMFRRSTPAEERARCAREIRDFLDGVVTEKERRPGDDVLSRLLSRQRAAGGPDHEAVVSMAFVLLVAGHVTTSNMIALSVLALLTHPARLARLRAQPERFPTAVEELLRYFTVVEAATARTATADVEIGGVTIRAGEGVVALGQAANRDPAVFERPDEFDPDRDARAHLAFGHGRHICPGQHLARLELEVALGRLVRRLPGLRLAVAVDDLSLKEDGNIFGLYALPVAW
ncbi:cytochrome P450 [Micromonospora craterilacus]|uniref:Cytochrome P450 n=1 Tax=Micromonospora craterilacus TaxID=1655439 RepID=A0A2W2ENX3_9ACTN|nr:cytochrome P450 [Micromonospora craterilacus]PZG24431.1 cytochrome P450 [Micromonospora craterilacus]